MKRERAGNQSDVLPRWTLFLDFPICHLVWLSFFVLLFYHPSHSIFDLLTFTEHYPSIHHRDCRIEASISIYLSLVLSFLPNRSQPFVLPSQSCPIHIHIQSNPSSNQRCHQQEHWHQDRINKLNLNLMNQAMVQSSQSHPPMQPNPNHPLHLLLLLHPQSHLLQR